MGKWIHLKDDEASRGDRQACPVVDDHGVRCVKYFRRPEHLKRHIFTHGGSKRVYCRVCNKAFGRIDNRNAHYWTHISLPGQGRCKNPKYALEEVEDMVKDPRVIKWLRNKWKVVTGPEP
ncbi:hypothetical protein K491DRAFT_614138 [Lophiostoma macrostomum CBS 122681]|uniref:C2H2-type domain-containing protein n=1 Tax=Lophiostoma macrostomum CBS 122681 TaxID=1314788 RepID=A0A6A6SJG2_9PLEO|nr:hypothetical protein K491DRAFT_614138 [Lophiostoma macrostomum CBS 122681]